MKLLVINGPNLNLLGLREPAIYGSQNYESLLALIRAACDAEGIEVGFAQSGGHGGFAAAGHSDENDVPQSVVHGALHPPQGFIADHRAGELLAGALGLGHQHGKSACMGNPQLFCL